MNLHFLVILFCVSMTTSEVEYQIFGHTSLSFSGSLISEEESENLDFM